MTLTSKAINNWEYSLSLIIDSTLQGIIAVDEDGYIVVFNEPARNLLGFKDDQVGRHIREIMPESRLPVVLHTGVAETGVRISANDNNFVANFTPIIKEKDIVGAVGVFEPLSNIQKIIETTSSAKEIQGVLTSLMDNTHDGIVVIDRHGQVVMCNEEFRAYLKTTKQKIMGRNISDVFPELSLADVLQSGEQEIADLKNIRGDDAIGINIPVYSGREICGAIGKIMFKHCYETDTLVNKVNMMKTKMAYYRNLLQKMSGAKYSIDSIKGKSQVISQLKDTIRKIAPSDSAVLLRGEPGTGKELFAHALHMESQRKHGPFIKVNCGAVQENFLEAEIFGYVDGAFAGAQKGGQASKFELADQGTILIDEIGNLSLSAQDRLLRVLHDKQVQRVGDDRLIPVDIRVVAATNQNIDDLVNKNLFRKDLYYRLNILSFFIPPLRDRKEDIEPLVNHFVEKYNEEFGKKVIAVSSEVYNIFVKHTWPGNVGELENVMERIFNVIEDQIIQIHHLPIYLKNLFGGPKRLSEKVSLKTIVEDTERSALIQALQRTGGNKVKAARMLGISRAGLYQKLEKYELLDE